MLADYIIALLFGVDIVYLLLTQYSYIFVVLKIKANAKDFFGAIEKYSSSFVCFCDNNGCTIVLVVAENSTLWI
jgi:hypothetical protein